MGGVDRCGRKKWYFSLICHGDQYDFLHLRKSIATSLLETYKRNAGRKTNLVSQNFRENSCFDGKDNLIRNVQKSPTSLHAMS